MGVRVNVRRFQRERCTVRGFRASFCLLSLLLYFVFVLLLFRAAPVAHGGSQARGPFGAVAADLHHSHSNSGSKAHLQPTPQSTAMPDL